MVPLVIRIGGEDVEQDDYRPVPDSDRGNDGYRDRGMLGGYSPAEKPFDCPQDVRFDAGYGADVDDLERGWCEPLITESPAYQLADYKFRSTLPRQTDVNNGDQEAMDDDFEFRNRNRRSKGFLTRPHVPVDRG
jgi:hypothetical protein